MNRIVAILCLILIGFLLVSCESKEYEKQLPTEDGVLNYEVVIIDYRVGEDCYPIIKHHQFLVQKIRSGNRVIPVLVGHLPDCQFCCEEGK